ncbi:hypothetical protein Q4Q54_04010 [Shewanella sp. SP2S2-4]|uniref:hypothetical protein n=1 Tax=Shewanella sp. SP2S2-4 TaxID=3063539 RepID=UPI0028901497|nr:hypothetical protein [Shewanella sp. SP2S2-4]MDT3272647.1 hypothetical protein [Shewanella sp. SP2S2-4]
MKTKSKNTQVTQNRLYRAVASSTAIETGKTTAEAEAKLKAKKSRFSHLTLA